MKLRTIITASAVAAPAAAQAQTTDPVGDNTGIVGTVHSSMELTLTQPARGFAAFARARSYEMSVAALVTTTDAPSSLSIVDGDATSVTLSTETP